MNHSVYKGYVNYKLRIYEFWEFLVVQLTIPVLWNVNMCCCMSGSQWFKWWSEQTDPWEWRQDIHLKWLSTWAVKCEMKDVMSNHMSMILRSQKCTSLKKCTYRFHHWQFCSWTGSCYHHVEYHPQSLYWCQGYRNQCCLQNASEVPLVVSLVSPKCVSLGGWQFLCWLLAKHYHWLLYFLQMMQWFLLLHLRHNSNIHYITIKSSCVISCAKVELLPNVL